MENMKIKFNCLMIYIISTFVYIYFVLSNRRDYQDTWILQDIFLPTIIFIFIFLATVIINNDNRIIALICSSFVVIMYLIPAIKYELFYGIADVTFHYGFVYEIMRSGYVPGGTFYSGNPGMQIFTSLFSLILGISPNTGFKYAIPISFGVYPLVIYFISNKLVQEDKLKKYVIISSAFPLITAYYLVGTIFPLLFLILLGPLVIIGEILDKQNKVKYRLISIVMLLGILISHTVTSLLFILFSLGSIILLVLYGMYIKKDIFSLLVNKFYVILIFAIILYIFWWMYESDYLFAIFTQTSIKTIRHFFYVDEPFRKTPIPQRFFEIPFINKMQIISLYHMKDIIIAMLSLSGIVIFYREKKKMNSVNTMFYSYSVSFLVAIFLILGLELLIKFGDLEYYRFINYGIIFSPFFVGLSLYKLKINFKINKIIEIFILLVIISVSLIQFFPYQPFTPKANIIDKNISGEEPLMYFHHVNTIYQKNVISFASNFSSNKSIIVSDEMTRLQMISFFNKSFDYIIAKDSNLIWYNPLTSENDHKWNLFLLHWNGKSGPFEERAEYRNKEILSKNRNTNGRNVIYDNGESFIIQRNFTYL